MKKLSLILIAATIISSCCMSQIPDQYAYVDEDCNAYLPDYRDEVITRDNCGIEYVEQIPAPGDAISETTEVEIRAVDINGNQNSIYFDVVILDTIKPTFDISEPPQPPNPNIEVLNYIDIDNTTIQRGLSEDELKAINNTYWYLGGELDDICETVGIVEHSDYTWFRNYHEQNTCCVEADTNVPSNGGSGLLWTLYMNISRAQYNWGTLTYTAIWPADYLPGDGCKMPGIQTTEGFDFEMTLAPMPDKGTAIMTMSHVNVADSVDVQWYCYPHLYADYKYGRTHSREGSGLPAGIIDRVAMGKEYTFSINWFGGDTGVTNGFIEWYRDGVLIDQWTGLNFTENPDIITDAWGVFTFAGGASQSYYAPLNTHWDIRNLVLHRDTSINYKEPSSADRIMEYPEEVKFDK